ncbi:hypothetical protein GDO78_009911 [Eleutherodactylus coqui]|uniref:Uncharacterized protein n=1 Tax=Eleutherodactylus coqui TaxID=57060 RepID=A0A8J6KCY9_ELECQ|nr:hypothetical protein GDO78_009911 [Eleutherodactylus coqui]
MSAQTPCKGAECQAECPLRVMMMPLVPGSASIGLLPNNGPDHCGLKRSVPFLKQPMLPSSSNAHRLGLCHPSPLLKGVFTRAPFTHDFCALREIAGEMNPFFLNGLS